METYIEGQRHQGQFDSQGVFTLDTLAALRITLASSLPEPHYYLFLLIQGLLAGSASAIEVAIGRHSTRIGFDDPHDLFTDLEAMRERLGRGLTLSSPNPQDMVLAGMATSVGQEMDRADLFGPNPDGETNVALEISLRQAQVVEHPGGRPTSHSTIFLHRNVSQSQSFAWTRVWGGRREEGEILRRFEHADPPVKVAGLATSPAPLWPDGIDPVGSLGPIILLEGAILAEPGQPAHRAHSTHPMLPAVDELGEEISPELNSRLSQRASLPQDEPPLPRCLFRRAFSGSGEILPGDLAPEIWRRRRWTFFFTSHRQSQACVAWVRHGMTMERQVVDLGWPGLYLLAPADDLDVDASGFSLVHNAKLEQRLDEGRELLRRVAASIGLADLVQLMERLGKPQETELMSKAFPWLSDSAP